MDQLPFLPEQSTGLALADGSTWGIAAGDEKACTIVVRLAAAMQLVPQQLPIYQLLVLSDGNGISKCTHHFTYELRRSAPKIFLRCKGDNTFTCVVPPTRKKAVLVDQLVQLSLVIAQQSQNIGGILLHGALIERDGWGVILAGPGGAGKTTASRRLPAPWCSLSDDQVLVVRDGNGAYWTHPWPTWSDLMSGGKGGTWNVNHAIPLKAIFFLAHAQHDSLEPVGKGKSACLLVESEKQASWPLSRFLREEEARIIHLQRFENICALAKIVRSYRLHLSLDGAFWEEIEQVIIREAKETS